MANDPGGPLQLYRSNRRALLPLDDRFHVPRSLRRVLNSGRFQLRLNRSFAEVLAGCAARPSTWISDELAAVYLRLHADGVAHSVESWDEQGLAGGLLAIGIGSCWIGESMFHHRPHASNVVLVELARALRRGGFSLFDVQLTNPHLQRFGCYEVEDNHYQQLLISARSRTATLKLQEACLRCEAWMPG